MSLKTTLYEEIKSRGQISIDEMYRICDREHRKHDNGTRRLRDLMKAGLVDKVVDEYRAIIAYKLSREEKSGVQPICHKPIENITIKQTGGNYAISGLDGNIVKVGTIVGVKFYDTKTEYDCKLKALLAKTKFGDVERITIINKAIKSTREWDKLQVIKLYDK